MILAIGDLSYFAPLSSFKAKHCKMRNSLDFLKIGNYAVINLNCMFPVPDGVYHRVDIPGEKDSRYCDLLAAELRIIRRNEGRIKKSAASLYRYKLSHGNGDRLAARCNDFPALEAVCRDYRASAD